MSTETTALVIFVITYIGIIFTRLPWVNIDRPSAAFFGAVAMIVAGIMTFDEAIAAIDFNTIALLLGMMIIIADLQTEGIIAKATDVILKKIQTTRQLLAVIILITGIGSAFLVNDAVVLIMTPIIITVCLGSKLNPVPYLIACILSSNTGSVMTMTGNPQNMLIGITSGMSYGKFFVHLFPVSLCGSTLVYFVIRLLYRLDFQKNTSVSHSPEKNALSKRTLYFTVPMFILLVIALFLNGLLSISIPLIALAFASLILLLGKTRPSHIIKQVDWVLLLFFISLFIVVHGFEKTDFMQSIKTLFHYDSSLNGNIILHFLTLGTSQIISNVPYTIAMIPVLKPVGSDSLWLLLASASSLSGNATIIGAIANLIVIESAKKMGIHIGFSEFFKSGILVTLLSFICSIFLIQLQIILNLI